MALALNLYLPVAVIEEGVREPERQAFDTAGGVYDAAYLLRGFPERALSIWLIREDISYPGHDFLFGAASRNAAVVSAFRTGFGENLHKEACHELGHLLGLAHCENPCFMRASPNLKRLEAKPLSLCPECYSRLEKSST